ncbi:hypothetical protein C8R46DRAFT_1082576 [Mycena filopes]|nr:hypothetical protein C8R46DRAFT_1082576 [Mycena filopes]
MMSSGGVHSQQRPLWHLKYTATAMLRRRAVEVEVIAASCLALCTEHNMRKPPCSVHHRAPPPPPPPPPLVQIMVGQSQKIGIALEAAELGLGVVGGVAQVLPIPYAQQGIALAQKILNTTQQTRTNKEDYTRLDKDLRELVGVADGLMARAQSTERKKSLRSLVCLLTELINLGLERASQNVFLRLLSSGADVAKIKNYREQIEHAVTLFMVEAIANIDARTEQMAEDARKSEPQVTRRRRRDRHSSPEISVLPAPSSLPTLPPVWTVFNNPVGNFIDLRSEGTVTVMTLNGEHLMTTKD